MSTARQLTVTCPHCKGKLSCTAFESINTELDATLAHQVLTGDPFTVHCPHCSRPVTPNYPTLWHDMKHHAMIQYTASDDEDVIDEHIKSAQEAFEHFRKMGITVKTELRIVTDRVEFREKAMIFNEGLDDRVIEMMKLIILSTLDRQKDEMPAELHFFVSNKQRGFAAVSDAGELMGTVPFLNDMYSDFVQLMTFEDDESNDYFVNVGWAADYLQAHPTLFEDEV